MDVIRVLYCWVPEKQGCPRRVWNHLLGIFHCKLIVKVFGVNLLVYFLFSFAVGMQTISVLLCGLDLSCFVILMTFKIKRSSLPEALKQIRRVGDGRGW